MPLKPKKITAFIYLILLGGIGFGQTGNPPPAQTNPGLSPDQAELNRQRENRRSEQRQQQAMRDLERDKNLGARRSNAKDKPLTREEINRINALLAPAAEDLAKYTRFLENSKTGLFRLFSNLNCESKNLLRVDGSCENFVPGGSSYSFRTKIHGAADLFDIRLDGSDLIADAFLSQEILVPLGDIALDAVSLETDGMQFLNNFNAEVGIQKVRKQFAEIAGVIKFDKFYYSKRVKAVENMTYAMRIIAYGNQTKIALRGRNESSQEFSRFLQVNQDKRVDLTVAFRIIRKEGNTNISILWKELKRENAPEIVFGKDEKLADIKDY